MLPFERIRAPPTAVQARGVSPTRGGSPVEQHNGGATMNASSPGVVGTVRPHSRPVGQPGQQAMHPHLARSRAVMMPQTPNASKGRQQSPPRAAGSPPPSPPRAHQHQQQQQPMTSSSVKPPLPPQGQGFHRHSPERGSPEAIFTRRTHGASVKELAVTHEVSLNLKAFDLDRQLPVADPAHPPVPKFAVAAKDGVFECDPSKAPIGGATTDPVRDEACGGVLVDLVTVPAFCRFIVDSDEVGTDRCLQYHVFAEAPEMFARLPAVTPDGTLTFAVSRSFTGSGAAVWLRLADNAAISATGEIATSEPIPVFFSVPGREAGKRAVPKGKDWHSFKNKANAPSMHLEPALLTSKASVSTATPGGGAQSPNRGTNASSSTALATTTASGSPQQQHHHQNPTSPALGASSSGGGADEAPAAYVFPPVNIHTLREDGLDADPLIRSEAESVTIAPERKTLPGLLQPPVFSSLVTDLERLRSVQLSMERTRLAGERIDASQLADTEARLREKLLGAGAASSPSLETVPILTRLGQLALQRGGQHVGGAVENFEQACRARMTALGMKNATDFGALAKTCKGDAEAHDQVEPLVVSLTVLATALKHAARFAEGLEFANSATLLAKQALGKDHTAHIRALSQVAELQFLLGEYRGALVSYRESLELCDIILGRTSGSATSVRHLIGACYSALQMPQEAMEAHDDALTVREEAHAALQAREQADLEALDVGASEAAKDAIHTKHAQGLAQSAFQVAESLVFCARAAYLRGEMDIGAERITEGRRILAAFDVSADAEYAVAFMTLSTIAASVDLAQGENATAIVEMHKAAAAVCRACGEASTEHAVAACRLSIVMLQVKAADRQPELSAALEHEYSLHSIRTRVFRAVSTLTKNAGAHHPTTARAACLLAQIDACGVSCGLRDADADVAFTNAERAYRNLDHSLGHAHRDTGAAAEAVAIAAVVKRDDKAAAAHLLIAVDIAKRHGLSRRLQRLLTRLMLVHGRLREPLPEHVTAIAEDAYQQVRSSVGESSPMCLEPLQNMAEVSYHSGDLERAHHYLTKALKVADANNMIFLLGPLFKPAAQLSTADVNERNRLAANRLDRTKAMSFAAVLFSIACVFEAQGRAREAQSTLLQVLAALELSGHHASIHTAETLRALGTLLYRDGFFGDALAYCEKSLGLLLEYHPTARDYVALAQGAIAILDKQILSNGYALTRHTESRFRFAVFL